MTLSMKYEIWIHYFLSLRPFDVSLMCIQIKRDFENVWTGARNSKYFFPPQDSRSRHDYKLKRSKHEINTTTSNIHHIAHHIDIIHFTTNNLSQLKKKFILYKAKLVKMVVVDSPRTVATAAKAKKSRFAFLLVSLALVVILFVIRSATDGSATTISSRPNSVDQRTTKITSNDLIFNNNNKQQGSKSLTIDNNKETTQYQSSSTPEQQQQPKPIKQISLLGERNSGTRWSWQ